MKVFRLVFFVMLFASACAPSTQEQVTSQAPAATATVKAATETPTATHTATPTETSTPTITFTPTITASPTVTATPTFAFPTVTVNKQAHCRYGPSVAYLHAADLYPGDVGSVRGRYVYSKWLYIKFDKLNYFCWVAPNRGGCRWRRFHGRLQGTQPAVHWEQSIWAAQRRDCRARWRSSHDQLEIKWR